MGSSLASQAMTGVSHIVAFVALQGVSAFCVVGTDPMRTSVLTRAWPACCSLPALDLHHNLHCPFHLQTADDLLARALYALEAAWPSAFNPVTAAVRLDIEKPENKGLFLALFRHAQVCVGQGEGSVRS